MHSLHLLLAGATFFYLAGCFLSDAFDARYDRDHRRQRPIPAGEIQSVTVFGWGWTWLVLGLAALFWINRNTGLWGLGLAAWIVFYSAIHRKVTISPALLGVSRFLLYPLAASTGLLGVTGNAVWCGLALGCYFIGVRILQQRTSTAPGYWAMAPMTVPMLLAALLNGPGYRESALLLSAVVGLWTIYQLRKLFWASSEQVYARSGLEAGLVFVDWLAVPYGPRWLSMVFIGLFFTALLLQRIPPSPASERIFAASR